MLPSADGSFQDTPIQGPAAAEESAPLDVHPGAPPPLDVSSAEPAPPEILGPARAQLLGRASAGGAERVAVALSADAVWIQEKTRLRRLALGEVSDLRVLEDEGELTLVVGGGAEAETLCLVFARPGEARRWEGEIESRRRAFAPGPEVASSPEGVTLFVQDPGGPERDLGPVQWRDGDRAFADRALQVLAALRGANAVINLRRERAVEGDRAVWQVAGQAVRLEGPSPERRYGQDVNRLTRAMAMLMAGEVALLATASFILRDYNAVPAGEAAPQVLSELGLTLLFVVGWPLVLISLLRVLHWPHLLRPAGIAVLAASAGRGLAVVGAHLAAWLAARPGIEVRPVAGTLGFCAVFDPIDWVMIVLGFRFCGRAWRLARQAPRMLPADHPGPIRPPLLGRVLVHVATAVFAVGLVSSAAVSRYQASAYLLQPGVDPRKEEEALAALNEGLEKSRAGDLSAGERSLRRALPLWEELAKKPSSPAAYKVNLALTHRTLGEIYFQRGDKEAAEGEYAQAVAAGSGVTTAEAGSYAADMADAKETLLRLRAENEEAGLKVRDRAARRDYEEALVKDERAPDEAVRLYRQAIASWESILPHADNPDYRRSTTSMLGMAYYSLGEALHRQKKMAEAETAWTQAVDAFAKVVALDAAGPLARRRLDDARKSLDGLRDQRYAEQVDQLTDAGRFADAVDVQARGVDELEARLGATPGHAATVSRLAQRLDHLALLLAHCPDERVRDTKAAVRKARRATELEPQEGFRWYALALVQYRDGAWRESLAALERMKAHSGAEPDARYWFLVAMDRQQLKERSAAVEALRKGKAWMEAQTSEDQDPAHRAGFELLRPAIEPLRREAERLLQGKDPEGDKVG